MATFALVHGSWLGAWCWELVAPVLGEAGHDVVAVDLPCEDGSATLDVYAGVVCASLAGRDDNVVLVGHSFGGHTVPLVAERRPVRHAVYLCGVVPEIGRSTMDQLAAEPNMLNPLWQKGTSEPDEQSRTKWVDFDIAQQIVFHDCDDRTARTAFDRLRPQALYPLTLPLGLTEFPAVPNTYVVCRDDQFLRPEWSKRVARDRLDADLIELPGSHSPFLSRPQAVADVLLGIAENV
jgi:pimeloyl-ACP methyl ester carboxylesterase